MNIISVKLRCLHLTFSSVSLVRGVGGKLSRLVYLAPRPGFGSGSVISQFLLTIILEYLVLRDINIILVKLTCFHPTFSLVTLVRGVGGGGASCPGWFILPPAQDLGQTVSSVSFYCTIILEYLVVWDINMISVKLKCLHPMFSLVILFRGLGASCPGWFILPPAQDLGQAVSSVNSYCTINLEYLVVRDINIISVKQRCLHPMFSLVTLVRGVGGGGKLSRLVYLAPHPGFESGIVISQFLLHHNLGKLSCKSCEYYPDWFILPHAQDILIAPSVNSYCTITLEYLVVSVVNIISVKLRCLHLTLSSVILVRGVGGKLSRLVYWNSGRGGAR